MTEPREKTLARFFSKIQFDKGHWIWIGSKNNDGYGYFNYNRTHVYAHRFSYQYFIGPLNDHWTLHKKICGIPSCVNPDHLYAGTVVDNNRDAREWGNGYKFKVRKGEENFMSKLTKSQVIEIRKLHHQERIKHKDIAKRFNVATKTVEHICQGDSWKHIKLGATKYRCANCGILTTGKAINYPTTPEGPRLPRFHSTSISSPCPGIYKRAEPVNV